METMEASRWQRSGSSIIWSPQLLGPLITGGVATPMRTLIGWRRDGLPDAVPGDQQYVLVGGLQAVLETLLTESSDAAYTWLRQHMLPLVREFQRHWPNTALIFGMDGLTKLFQHNESDDLVYFGRAKAREEKVKITLGIWNGAATGDGAFRIAVPETGEVGGYHVQRVS